jgi:hypothetical protein
MALIKEYYNKRFDVTIADCYWKIELDSGLNGGKERINVRMNCFKTKEIADTNRNKYSDIDFNFTPDLNLEAENFIAQAYAYAKTLPQFAGALDA